MMLSERRPVLNILLMTAMSALIVFGLRSRPVASMAGETAVTAPSLSSSVEIPTQQIIIQYRANADLNGGKAPNSLQQMQALRTVTGTELTYFRPMSGGAHVLRLPEPLPAAEVEEIAAQIESLPDVVYAEPDQVMSLAFIPNDPQYGSQWHYFEAYGINAPAAWNITTGAPHVRIAVLDNGITDHVDLVGRWVGGYDFITNAVWANDGNGRDADPLDPGDWVEANECFTGSTLRYSSWHGTHVAGTIGAAGHNTIGVAGVNWISPLVPVRVVGKCGGLVSDIADGMRWAAGVPVNGIPTNPHPAKVLNLSLGGPGVCSTTYQNAIDAVNVVGGIIVVAAGNSNTNLNTTTYQPANCNGVITVAATDRSGDKALYSNYGAMVKISAPGGENVPVAQNGVLSTSNAGLTVPTADAYKYNQGTSMAAPHVAGVVSLLLSLDPTLNVTQTLQILQTTAQPFPTGSGCSTSLCGSGIVDAAAALSTLPAPSPTPLPPTATPTNTPLPPIATSTNTPLSPTATSTNTPLAPTATSTNTPVNPPSPTPTPTNTPTVTLTPLSPTATSTPSSTPTPINAPTVTPTPLPPTATSTPSSTPTPINAPTVTPTPLPPTATSTPSSTPTPTNTSLPTATAVVISLDYFVYLPTIMNPSNQGELASFSSFPRR